jgi:predicted ATPase
MNTLEVSIWNEYFANEVQGYVACYQEFAQNRQGGDAPWEDTSCRTRIVAQSWLIDPQSSSRGSSIALDITPTKKGGPPKRAEETV